MLNIIADVLTGRLKAQARQRAIVVALFGLAALMLVVALAHALAALRTWLSSRYDPIVADLMVCGGFVTLAAILAVAAQIVSRRKPSVDANAALTGALAPMALAMFADILKPRAEKPTPAPEASPRAAEAAKTESVAPQNAADHKVGSAALVLLPLVLAGLLFGRKLRS